MKRIHIITGFLALAISAHGQVSNPSVQYASVAPSGACVASPPIQVVISTGAVYTCNNGTWGQSGSGAPVRALANRFNDVFQRTGTDLGTGYTDYANSWVPNSGAAHGTSTTVSIPNLTAYTGASATAPSQRVRMVLSTIATGGGDYTGPAVRISGTPHTSFNTYYCTEGGGNIYLAKIVGGSDSSLGTNTTLATTTATTASGDILDLTVVGNTLICIQNNGAKALYYNDSSSPLTTGYPGLLDLHGGNRVSSYTFTNGTPNAGCNVNIVADGDSETYGVGISSPYTDSIYTSLGTSPCITNLGVGYKAMGVTSVLPGGGSAESMITTGTSVIDPLIVPGAKNIDVVWGCTNDIAIDSRTPAQCHTDTATYVAARQAAGWKVVVVQTLSRATFDQSMQYLNQLNASGTGADAIVTLPPALTGTSAYANTTLFQADQVHGTQLTMTGFVAPAVSAAINSLP